MAITRRYRDYLKSPAWQRKRQEVFARYGKRCFACKKTRGPIQVHHLSYAHLGNERLTELRPLCAPCHRAVTKLHYKMGRRKSGYEVFAKFMESKK